MKDCSINYDKNYKVVFYCLTDRCLKHEYLDTYDGAVERFEELEEITDEVILFQRKSTNQWKIVNLLEFKDHE